MPLTPFSTGSDPFVCGLSPDASFVTPFLADWDLPFDEGALVGTGLSLEFELCEFERAFSPLVEDEDSLLDLRFLRSPGISEVTVCLNAERQVRPDDARRQSQTAADQAGPVKCSCV